MYFSSGVFLTATIGKPLSEVHIDASFGYFSQSTQSDSIHWILTHYKQTPDMTWAATADLIIPATLAATIAISLAIALVTPGFSKESWEFDGFLISWYTPDLITCWSLWFHNWNSASLKPKLSASLKVDIAPSEQVRAVHDAQENSDKGTLDDSNTASICL